MSRREEVHHMGGYWGKVDKLGHLVWSCLSGRKEYTKNEESLRALLETEAFRMLDSIPKGSPRYNCSDPGLRAHFC